MNKICTSIEQSKKLIELGIDVNTVDMFYADLFIDNNHKYNLHPLESYGFKTFEETKLKTSDHLNFIPAWSLSALLGLIPNFNMFKRTIECKIETTNHLIDKACEPIDAAFEMICWLLENKNI